MKNTNWNMAAMSLLVAIGTMGTTVAMADAYSDIVKSLNPNCYWRLDETAGTTATDIVGGKNGTYIETATTYGRTGVIPGNSAVYFNGSASAIKINDGVGIGSTANATFICWVKPEGTQVAFTPLVFNRAGTGQTSGLNIRENNNLGYHWNDGQHGFISNLALTDGAWNFAALTVSPTAATFYLGDMNGNLQVAVNEVVHEASRITDIFTLGGEVAGSADRMYKGDMDEAMVFGRTLSADEVDLLYKSALTNLTNVEIITERENLYAGDITLRANANAMVTSYQWFRDGTAIGEASLDARILSGKLEAGSYTVKAVSNAGKSVTSGALTILPASAPIISTQPTVLGEGKRYVGGRVVSIVDADGSYPMTYQWYIGNKAIEGATDAKLNLIGLTDADFGSYSVKVTNAEGTVQSASFTVSKVAVQSGGFAEAVLARHPLAFYRFDDELDDNMGLTDDLGNPVNGYAADYAGGNVGYYYGVYSWDQIEKEDSALAKSDSKAIGFRGASYVGTRLQLNEMSSSGFTTMGWVRRSLEYGEYTTRGGYFGQNDLCEFGDGNDASKIECWCATGMQIKTDFTFEDKVWGLIALTYDGNKLALYLDGKEVGSTTGTLDHKAGASYFFNVGGGGIFNNPETNMDYFMGDIDEIAFFNEAMSAEDIQEFWSKGFYGPGVAPEIRKNPVDVKGYENAEHNWTMTVSAGGTTPLSYQWYWNGEAIEGATTDSITGSFIAEDAGSFTVTVSNNYGSVTSSPATVTVLTPKAGSYEAAVVDLAPYAYWRLGEKSGSTAYEYVSGRNGNYTADQTLGQPGAIKGDNDTAILSTKYFYAPLSAASQSALTMACWVKPNGSQVNYTEVMFDRGNKAIGMDIVDGQLCYHWNDTQYNYRSGLYLVENEWNFIAMVGNANGTTFYLGDTQGNLQTATDATAHEAFSLTASFTIGGGITIADRQFNGAIDEPVVFLRALSAEELSGLYSLGVAGPGAAPAIKGQPADVEAFVGDTASITVSAIGSPTLTYQWYKDGEILEGATTATLNFNLDIEDAGEYSAVVSNDFGSVTSETAVITPVYKPYSIDLTGDKYQLFAHYTFDKDYSDSGSAGNDAYLEGEEAPIVEGFLGNAVKLASDTEMGTYSSLGIGGLEINSEPLTVAFWTRIYNTPPDLPWFCNNQNAYGGWGLTYAPSYNRNGWSYSLVSDDGYSQVTVQAYGPDNVIPNETWHHLVYVLNPEDRTLKVFFDGELAAKTSLGNLDLANIDTGNPFHIGQDGTGYYAETATIDVDDMGIWKTALSDLDARSIYIVAQNGLSFDKIVSVPPTAEAGPDLIVYENADKSQNIYVTATGPEPRTYQWFKNGTKIEGATKSTLEVAFTAESAGAYTCEVNNEFGSAVSDEITVSFRTPVEGYETYVANLNPVAYYRFDSDLEAGVAYDYAGGFNATYVNLTADKVVDGAIAEDESKAIYFDGEVSNSYVGTPVKLNGLVASNEYSFMGWVKLPEDFVWSKNTGYFGQNDLNEFGQDSASNIRCWSSGAGNISATAPNKGEWAMITYTYKYDGTNASLAIYVNTVGSFITTTTPINATAGAAYFFNIAGGGIWNSTGDYFTGAMDEIAVFPTCLTAEQISALYSFGTMGPGAAPEIQASPVGGETYSNDNIWTLTVSAAGTPPLTVKWLHNGEDSGYTGATIQIPMIQGNDGSWVAEVSNDYGTVQTEPAVITYHPVKSGSYEALIASYSPVAYWRLGDEQGSEYGAEFAGNHRAIYGPATVLGAEGAIANDSNTAATFNGQSWGSTLRSAFTTENLNVSGTSELTYLLWVKRNGAQIGYSPLMGNRGNKTTLMHVFDNGELGYHWNDSNWAFRSGLILEDGQWNLAAMVVTPTEATFYLGTSDGTLSTGANVAAHASTALVNTFLVGGDSVNTSRCFKGDLDEISVFTYALTADDIQAIFKKGRGEGKPEAPVLGYQITEEGLTLMWAAGARAKLQVSTAANGEWLTVEDTELVGGAFRYTIGFDAAKSAYFRLIVE